jgi:ABC-2 type transport system ATP-binding protein
MMTQQLEPPRPIGDGSPAIEVDGLTKRFGEIVAVRDLSFRVKAGRVTGFLGPNGAGKSTTLRMILGLVRPTEGKASVLGAPYRSLTRPSQAVGAVLETQSFHPLRSGRNHLRTIAVAAGIPEAGVDALLERVDLGDTADRKVGKYSLGMRQRVGLAGALLADPRVLILDEPANGLDPQGIRWLREFLRTFVAEGKAVLVSSHLLSEIAQMADEVIVIRRGELVRQGTVNELTAGTSEVRVVSPEPERLETVLRAEGMVVHRDAGGGLVVRETTPERIGTVAFTARVPLFELATQQSTLEDAFFELITEEGSA